MGAIDAIIFSKAISSGGGIILGIYIAKQLESKYVGFSSKEGLKSIPVFIVRMVIGFILSGLTYFGLKILFAAVDEGSMVLRFTRYFFVGIVGMFLVPYLFTQVETKMKLISEPTEAV